MADLLIFTGKSFCVQAHNCGTAFYQKRFQKPGSRLKVRRRPMKKPSPPHILADEHFDPPEADQMGF